MLPEAPAVTDPWVTEAGVPVKWTGLQCLAMSTLMERRALNFHCEDNTIFLLSTPLS